MFQTQIIVPKPLALSQEYHKPAMHNPTKKLSGSPGLVFSVWQYLNSAINIYPTATIIFKFWVLLQQIFYKKGVQTFSEKNSYNLIYPKWLDKNITFRAIPPPFPKMVFRDETMPLHSMILLDFKNMEKFRKDNQGIFWETTKVPSWKN